MSQALIDTHIHVWDLQRLEYAWLQNRTDMLNRTYDLAELEQDRLEAGVTGGILVQAANNLEDTDFMLEVAANSAWINGVIGWLPLTDPEQTTRLLREKYLKDPYFRGVRHLIHDEPDPKWLLQEPVLESLRELQRHGLVYDVVGVSTEHIETALKVSDELPNLTLVFDHLNQPPMANGAEFGRWGELMAEAARRPQFYAKISGLGLASKKPGDWSVEDIAPCISYVVGQFGASRCLLGSDWPLCLLAGGYAKGWEAYLQVLSSLLDEGARERVRWQNATQVYQLAP